MTTNARYHTFGAGALSGTCEKTAAWDAAAFMPHAAPLLRGMAFEADAAGARDEAGTTYLMARDEDGENMFHSAADFLNAYLVSRVLGSDRSDWVTVLFDRMPDFAYASLIEKTFSRRGPPRRAADYGGRVRFETLVFHLESPAGIVRRPAAATTFERLWAAEPVRSSPPSR